MAKSPFRVLVIRAGQLGDTVCASSIIEPLRSMYGNDVVIDWVAKAGIGRVFAADPRINQVYELSSRRAPLLFNRAKFNVVLASLRQSYNLVVNLELGGFFDNTVRLLKADKKIGRPYQLFSEPPETHAVENLHLIYKSFMSADALSLAVPKMIGTDEKLIRQRYPLAARYIVLVPSNSHHKLPPERNFRNWPVAHWRELLKILAEADRQVVLVGGKNENEYFKLLKPYPYNVLDLSGKTAFPDLVGVLAVADVVVSTDTGPAHIAAAVSTPVVALIGPTNPKRTAPYRTKDSAVQVLSANLPCSPCYHSPRFQACKKNQCMYDIEPDQVRDAVVVL
ncbi:glycosyltransferase family 9 protein [Kaarinaea lacus]